MAKKVATQVKLQIPAGQANPSPPVGPALGQAGVNIMDFCKAFNAETQGQEGMIIPPFFVNLFKRFISKTSPGYQTVNSECASMSFARIASLYGQWPSHGAGQDLHMIAFRDFGTLAYLPIAYFSWP